MKEHKRKMKQEKATRSGLLAGMNYFSMISNGCEKPRRKAMCKYKI